MQNPDGNVVQIGRPTKTRSPTCRLREQGDDESRPAPPKFWIGLLGGAIPADNPLRAHLDLPENQGLLVANIMPEQPGRESWPEAVRHFAEGQRQRPA